ncbi:uncharacterized protein B0H18DRAFT_1006601 [Fomitopsis serialis]|uniref:uncharacterized protein n=1 Tax=Fomitopsis serialis TaxID=139415 RepID=UPI0020081754|nr:uncharacterized protein B0H18DRAFT_1006601 [Neoantrodia serialis]KAH9926118.1 hypothetical protein B0H18DRAFT_1006601 [Neoantrodia serialis]
MSLGLPHQRQQSTQRQTMADILIIQPPRNVGIHGSVVGVDVDGCIEFLLLIVSTCYV